MYLSMIVKPIALIIIVSSLLQNCYCSNSSDSADLQKANEIVRIVSISVPAVAATIAAITILIVYCLPFNKLKRKYNEVDSRSMGLDVYERNKQAILDGFNSAINNQMFSQYKQNNRENVKVNFVEGFNEKPFLTRLKISAQDSLGSWTSKGYILCRRGQIFLWMLKEYNQKLKNQQGVKIKHIVYESDSLQPGFIKGKWFYLDHESDPSCSGTWTLSLQQAQARAETQRNLITDNQLNPQIMRNQPKK